MKNKTQGLLTTAILIALLAILPNTSLALFGGAKARLRGQADGKYAEAVSAGDDGRVLDEIAALTEARALYMKLLAEHPGYSEKHVSERLGLCVAHLRALTAQIKSGDIAVPPPEAIVTGAGKGYVDAKAASDSAHTPPPMLSSETPASPSATKSAADPAPPLVSAPSREVPTAKSTLAKPSPPSAPMPAEKRADAETPPRPTPQSAIAKADDRMRTLLINELIRSGEASEAMMILEDIIEAEADSTSETTRLLFVRALMECRNYKRAQDELAEVLAKNPSSPSVRSLSTALAVQKGNLPEAVYQLDRLIQDYPAYSDAYVNLAYVYLMMNPVKNRDMAIVYYRSAIAYGAKRDPRLESDLNIEIVP